MNATITAGIGASAVVIALAGFAVSVARSDELRTEAGRGTLSVHLTDAPFVGDAVESVDVFVVRVDARLADSDSVSAATGADDDSANTGGWITLASPNTRVNLLAYQDGAALSIGLSTVPTGTYLGFRLVIDPSRSSVASGPVS